MKLSSKSSSPVKAALKDVQALGYENPLNWRETIIGNKVGVEVAYLGDDLLLQHIRTFESGSGYASKALKMITDIADAHGVSMRLNVSPTGKTGLNKRQLFSWYGRHGFQRQRYLDGGLNDEMVRAPKGKNPVSGFIPTQKNIKELGAFIYETLWSADGFALADKHDFDMWHVGGCFGLAYALQKWIGAGDIWVVVDKSLPYPRSMDAQHFALKIGDYFIDGSPKNAAKKKDQFLKYWSGDIKSPRLIALEGPEVDRRDAASVAVSDDTKCSSGVVGDVIKLLDERYSRMFK